MIKEYAQRLERCGFSADEAYRTVYCMIKDFGFIELEDLISSIERECYALD